MLERIMVPLDGSELAEAILSQLGRLLRRPDSEVIVVRAVVPAYAVEAGDSVFAWPALREAAEKYVAGCVQKLQTAGVHARGITRVGLPAHVILDAAVRERATLVAMTTHGRTGLSRWVLGSVAEKIVRSGDFPVLLVRSFQPGGDGQPAATPARELAIRKIMVPIDMGDLSLQIVPYAAELAQLFQSQVSIVHVLQDDLAMPVPEMKRAAEQFAERGIRIEPTLGRGDPASQILEECRNQSADLIAMTTHGRSGVTRWVLGSVTEKVLRSSGVPMLVVRGHEKTSLVFSA